MSQKGSLGVTGKVSAIGGHGFTPWKQPLAEIQGKVAYDKPLWWGPSPDTAHSGSFSESGCPLVFGNLKREDNLSPLCGGWAFADTVLHRLAPLWVAASGLEFTWD
ncbi:hypothetical protein P3S68_026912 [Capsicum galapagoense]